jgi:uncharacterized Zn-finger protein
MKFFRKDTLQAHEKRRHAAENKPRGGTVPKTHECSKCRKLFAKLAWLEKHQNKCAAEDTILRKIHSCPHCSKSFVGKGTLLNHQCKNSKCNRPLSPGEINAHTLAL